MYNEYIHETMLMYSHFSATFTLTNHIVKSSEGSVAL